MCLVTTKDCTREPNRTADSKNLSFGSFKLGSPSGSTSARHHEALEANTNALLQRLPKDSTRKTCTNGGSRTTTTSVSSLFAFSSSATDVFGTFVALPHHQEDFCTSGATTSGAPTPRKVAIGPLNVSDGRNNSTPFKKAAAGPWIIGSNRSIIHRSFSVKPDPEPRPTTLKTFMTFAPALAFVAYGRVKLCVGTRGSGSQISIS
mmetsp:Transcript_4362/g.14243  ORF Transcript_4362/g.14243 Transcript_4362/m.14243 type:complete len:205 (-) Transcript_4362:4803-5417(-)